MRKSKRKNTVSLKSKRERSVSLSCCVRARVRGGCESVSVLSSHLVMNKMTKEP